MHLPYIRHLVIPASLFTLSIIPAGCKSSQPADASHVHLDKWVDNRFAGRLMSTRNYDIYSTLTDVDFERRLPELLEAAHRRFTEIMPPTGTQPRKMQVYCFATRQQWEAFTRERFPARWTIYSRIHSGGFTEGNAAVVFYRGRAQTIATLIHEAWHLYAESRIAATVPAWLNEGLACYFESAEMRDDDAALSLAPARNPYRLNPLRKALHSGQLFSIEELISTNAGEVIDRGHSGLTQTYYAQVWALVTYLLHADDAAHAHSFRRLLAAIGSGEYRVRKSASRLDLQASSQSPDDAAFMYYFGVTPREMNAGYFSYLQKLAGYGDGFSAP